jgi:Glycosyltransferase Maf N-terminal domain/Protein of unknown function DUF115
MSLNEAVIAARRAFFVERFPGAAKLAQAGSGQFVLVTKDGAPVDITFGGRQMYAGDSRGFARAQVASYLEKPLRLFMDRLDHTGLVSPICINLVAALGDQLVGDGHEKLSTYPSDSPCFLVVFGLGLGHHLEELAERCAARWLILVEPLAGFFEQSFHSVDWPKLVASFEERGGGVEIVSEIDPGAIAASIVRAMAVHGVAFADGSWVFTHYPLWAFAEARKRLHEAIEFAFINRGFFEDELRMMENAVANFAGRSFHLLEGKPRLRRPELAVIVGAGPSLDEAIPTLRRIRDRVLLFSCGTALRPLLRSGLVPDFHCELENIPEVADVIEETAQYGDLRRVTLIASATVDPRVPPFFGDTIFFFRDAVSSTMILGNDHRILPGCAPTCVNLGFAAALYMGFVDLALFGADCGARLGGKAHAEGTIYRDLGMWQDKDRAREHPIELEGNFGGVVRTDWVYDACRLMLSASIRAHRVNVVNCSDGALIPPARPCVPDSFEVSGAPVDRTEFKASLRRDLKEFGPGEILRGVDFAALSEKCTLLFDRLRQLVADLDAGEADFAASYEAVHKLSIELDDTYGATEAIVTGTIAALPRIAMFFGFRIADPDARRRLYERYVREFRAVIEGMEVRTRQLFEALSALASEPRQAAE